MRRARIRGRVARRAAPGGGPEDGVRPGDRPRPRPDKPGATWPKGQAAIAYGRAMARKRWGRDGSGDRARSVTFELESFSWSAPDQLELTGCFAGLGEPPPGVPAIVVHGAGEVHRLVAAGDAQPWPPQDGAPWRGAFEWDEPPTPVDAAELEVGGVLLALPEPGTVAGGERRSLRVVGEDEGADTDADEDEPMESSVMVAGAGADAVAQDDDALRRQADLVLVREELREARAAQDTAEAELARAREQLDGERRRHADDAERFRAAVGEVRALAEASLAEERDGRAKLAAELAGVREELERSSARTAQLEVASGRAEAALAEAHQARAAAEQQVAELARAGHEAAELRESVEALRGAEADLRARLGAAEDEAARAREEARELRERLATIRAIAEGS
jgi:hypothetical protein